MKIITPFDPQSASNGTIETGIVNPCGKIYLRNESPVGLLLDLGQGNTAILGAWEVRLFRIPGARQPVTWQVLYNLTVGSAPLSTVLGESYEPSEDTSQLPQGFLARQTNIGNNVPIGTTVTQLINDGNSAQNVIEATLVGAPTSNVIIKNDGTVTIAEYVASILRDLFQLIPGATIAVKLGNTSRGTEVIGNFQVDGSTTLQAVSSGAITASGDISTTGDINFSGGQLKASSTTILDVSGFDSFYSTRGSSNLHHFSGSGTSDWATIGSTGINALNGINYNVGRIKDFNTFSGTGTGTFNHGLSGTPVDCWVTTNLSGSTQTVGCSTLGATTVKIDTGAGLAWRATAYR